MNLLSQWVHDQKIKETENTRLRFDREPPEIGERCLFTMRPQGPVFFGHRMSQNWYQSGMAQMRVDQAHAVVTLKETQKSEGGDVNEGDLPK